MTAPVSVLEVGTALATFVATHGPIPAAYGRIPTVGGKAVTARPYAIVDPVVNTRSGPAFGHRYADATTEFQIRVIGENLEQAQWGADKIDGALFDRTGDDWTHPLTIPGHRAWDRSSIPAGSPGDAGSDGMVTIVLRISVTTTRS